MAATKGYDDSPPRNGIIFFYTILTVFMLVGVKFLLDSYFFSMMTAEYQEKVWSRGMDEVRAVREREAEALRKGAMPIDQAMRTLGQRGRKASPLITPEGGQGAPEVAGWSQLKRQVEAPAAEPSEAEAPTEGSEAAPEKAPEQGAEEAN
jgi:hypothetical protein